ncbi:MAG TPA: hypothetical protein VKQ52_00070, partial [Puia sp.]|nr:hypothetical protein [Puia sp.]
GNITTYLRNGSSATSSTNMDNMTYSYLTGTNKLDHITDAVTTYCATCNDITNQSPGNYQYDSIGEMTADNAAGIANISWTVYGKVASITKSGDTTIQFTYDPEGNRISKAVIHAGDVSTTWYVRDAQGNILSTYTSGDPAVNGKDLTQIELDIYGTSRLGTWKRNVDVEMMTGSDSIALPLLGSGDSLIFTRGNKLFELVNHLGNVLSTISDKRFGVSFDDSTVAYYNPEIVSANDYYPFGMLQPGRTYTETGAGTYRFGFNGQEGDNEINGRGGAYSAKFWEYDPRIGRRWNIDPKSEEIHDVSPYLCLGDNPVLHDDPNGDFWHIIAGAIIGAVIDAGIEAGSQLIKHGSITSWKAIGGAAVQGAITGGVAAATGGASLAVSATTKVVIHVAAAAAANVVGGTLNRAVQGKKTTLADVGIDALAGAGGELAGKAVSKVAKGAVDKLSNQAKGKLGETLTQLKYAAKGYVRKGNAVVQTGRLTRVTREAEKAVYDHDFKQVITGKRLTVESKFNTSQLNIRQRLAQSKVQTVGGLIVDRTNSAQVSHVAKAATSNTVTGGTESVKQAVTGGSGSTKQQ